VSNPNIRNVQPPPATLSNPPSPAALNKIYADQYAKKKVSK
jgi:hypothetical protein